MRIAWRCGSRGRPSVIRIVPRQPPRAPDGQPTSMGTSPRGVTVTHDPIEMATEGGAWSVYVLMAGGPLLPTASVALTANVYVPSGRPSRL